jgi:hypothetical protein
VKVLSSSETSILTRATQHNIPVDGFLCQLSRSGEGKKFAENKATFLDELKAYRKCHFDTKNNIIVVCKNLKMNYTH